MWPPRQAATRTLKLSPTFLQVARGTCCTYSVTCLFKASSVLGLALYTSSFAAPHSQKSRGFRSGLWGAHSTSLFSAINLPGNSSFRYLIVPWAVWGGGPSCWYTCTRLGVTGDETRYHASHYGSSCHENNGTNTCLGSFPSWRKIWHLYIFRCFCFYSCWRRNNAYIYMIF